MSLFPASIELLGAKESLKTRVKTLFPVWAVFFLLTKFDSINWLCSAKTTPLWFLPHIDTRVFYMKGLLKLMRAEVGGVDRTRDSGDTCWWLGDLQNNQTVLGTTTTTLSSRESVRKRRKTNANVPQESFYKLSLISVKHIENRVIIPNVSGQSQEASPSLTGFVNILETVKNQSCFLRPKTCSKLVRILQQAWVCCGIIPLKTNMFESSAGRRLCRGAKRYVWIKKQNKKTQENPQGSVVKCLDVK